MDTKEKKTEQTRLFFPINDFNEEGYLILPLLPFLADKVVVWAPGGKFFDAANKQNPERFFFDKNDFREMVLMDNSPFQICTRDFWFDKDHEIHKTRRYSGFPLLQWDEDFDPYFIDAFQKDFSASKEANLSHNPDCIRDVKIFTNPSERGVNWAQEIFASSKEVDRLRVDYCWGIVKDPSKQTLMLEQKFGRCGTNEERVIQLLRDSYNTLESLNDTFSQTLHSTDEKTVGIYRAIYPEFDKRLKTTQTYTMPEHMILDVVDLCRLLAFDRNLDTFHKRLERSQNPNTDEGRLRHYLNKMIFCDFVVPEEFNDKPEGRTMNTLIGQMSLLRGKQTDEAISSISLIMASKEYDPNSPLSTVIQTLNPTRKRDEFEEIYVASYKNPNSEADFQILNDALIHM